MDRNRWKLSKGTALVGAVLLALLAVCVGGAVYAWMLLDGVTMTIHGIVALTLGVTLSLALGVGLMALVFYSSRAGYDDAADWRGE